MHKTVFLPTIIVQFFVHVKMYIQNFVQKVSGMAELYEIIDELCQKKGVSGAKMATDLGMSRSTLTELRRGRSRSFTLATAQKIADYFGVTVDTLAGRSFSQSEPTENRALATFQRALDDSGLRIEEFDQEDMEDIAAFMKMIRKKKKSADSPD